MGRNWIMVALVVVGAFFVLLVSRQRVRAPESPPLAAAGGPKIGAGATPGPLAATARPRLVIPVRKGDPAAEPFPEAVLATLGRCVEDFSDCEPSGKVQVPVVFQGIPSHLSQAEASWVVLLECARDQTLCPPDAGANSARFQELARKLNMADEMAARGFSDAGKDLVLRLSNWSEPIAAAVKRGPQAVGTYTGDYTHPNGPLTHGVGLQPESRTFTYPKGVTFPFNQTSQEIQGPNNQTYHLTRCEQLFAVSTAAQVCFLESKPGEVICPPFELPNGASLNEARVTVLPGVWENHRKGYVGKEGALTLACTHLDEGRLSTQASIAKCLLFARMCPDAKALGSFDACVRAITADYCGEGESHTVPGVTINLYTAKLQDNGQGYVPSRGASLCPSCQPGMFYEAAWAQDYAAKIAKPRLDHPTKRLSCRKDFEKGKPEGKKKKMIARPGNPEVLLWSRVLAHGADDMHAGEDPDCEPPPGHTLPRCLNAQAACK